jgi:hypothetical protein
MKTFVMLATRRFLDRACSDISAQFGFFKRRRALWLPDEMLGVWVGPEPDILSARVDSFQSSSPPRALNALSGVAAMGLWTMCWVDDSTLTRVRLLDELVAGSARAKRGHEPRFLPVFPRSALDETLRAELSQLTARHSDEVCAPLLMNPMTGALSPPSSRPTPPRQEV